MEFNVSRWYRLLEGVCQLVAVAALMYGTWQLVRAQSTDAHAIVRILPIPTLFLLTSLFFRLLSSGPRTGQSPVIANILNTFELMEITGVHLVVLAVLCVLGVIAAVTQADALTNLVKYLLGFFAGMQVEKRREKKAAAVRA